MALERVLRTGKRAVVPASGSSPRGHDEYWVL